MNVYNIIILGLLLIYIITLCDNISSIPRIQTKVIVAVIANPIQAAAGIYLGTTMQELI